MHFYIPKHRWSCTAKRNRSNFTSWVTTEPFFSNTGWPCNVTHICCFVKISQNSIGPPLYLLSIITVHWILKKQTKLTKYTKPTIKPPTNQHYCQNKLFPFNIYRKLIRLKINSVAGCVMWGRIIFPWDLFSEPHHCIDRKPETGLPGQVRIREEGFVISTVKSTKPVYKQAKT